jgi:succinate dehydrogenase / fumarate reductase cytochrome b subunit
MSVATFTPAPSKKFSKNPVVAFYQSSIGSHLSHGIASVIQTLGVNNRKMTESISKGGTILAWLVVAGFAVIPVVILLRIIS